MLIQSGKAYQQDLENRGTSDRRVVSHSGNKRSRSRGSYHISTRQILEEGDQAMDRHPHPSQDKSSSQCHISNAEVQEVPSLPIVPSG